jgi:hypothetical protein
MNYTVHQIRKAGNKVHVEHRRRYYDKINKQYVYMTAYEYTLVNPRFIEGPLATGGLTKLYITFKTGYECGAEARCSLKDNYNKKLGVNIALDRINRGALAVEIL